MRHKTAVAGAILGYMILSPFAMYVAHMVHAHKPYHEMSVLEVFDPGLWKWSLMFAVFGGMAGLFAGFLMERAKKEAEEARKAKEVAEEARKTLSDVLESLPCGVAVVGTDMRVRSVNRAAVEMMGHASAKEIEGAVCQHVFCPSERCPMLEPGKEFERSERMLFSKDGGKIPILKSVIPVELNGERVFIETFVDLSVVKEREARLLRSREAYFNMLGDLHSTVRELRGLLNDLIFSFANAIDAKSSWTHGHSERVTQYAMLIARQMGMGDEDINVLKTASLLHDIGKIGVPDGILDKPDRLSAGEFEHIKKHPLKGVEILGPIKNLKDIIPIVRAHHERLDGKGYPDGLSGGRIPLMARIITAADSYDSMTADRPYRPALGREFAIEEMHKYSGAQFDPEVVEAFMIILEKEPAPAAKD